LENQDVQTLARPWPTLRRPTLKVFIALPRIPRFPLPLARREAGSAWIGVWPYNPLCGPDVLDDDRIAVITARE